MAKKALKAREPERRLMTGDKDFALHYGVSTRTVQTWRDKGMPCEKTASRQYVYDLDKTDEWIDAFRATEANESAEIYKQLDEAKLRIDLAKALKLERDIERDAGNVLMRDEWELFASECIIAARDAFIGLTKQFRRHLCKKCQGKLKELDVLIAKALNRLADIGKGPPTDK